MIFNSYRGFGAAGPPPGKPVVLDPLARYRAAQTALRAAIDEFTRSADEAMQPRPPLAMTPMPPRPPIAVVQPLPKTSDIAPWQAAPKPSDYFAAPKPLPMPVLPVGMPAALTRPLPMPGASSGELPIATMPYVGQPIAVAPPQPVGLWGGLMKIFGFEQPQVVPTYEEGVAGAMMNGWGK